MSFIVVLEMRQKKILSAEDSQQNGVSIGEQAPVWVKDEDVTMCMTCAQRFGMVMRKHHCRGCGRVRNIHVSVQEGGFGPDLCRNCQQKIGLIVPITVSKVFLPYQAKCFRFTSF